MKSGKISTVNIIVVNSVIIIFLIMIGVVVASMDKIQHVKEEIEFKDLLSRVQKDYEISIAKGELEENATLEQYQVDEYISEELKGKMKIIDGVLVYTGQDAHKKQWSREVGIPPEHSYDRPYVPAGFYHVSGTWKTGYIISDSAEDANKNLDHNKIKTLKGNQYVWIPVDGNKVKYEERKYTKYVGTHTLYLDKSAVDLTSPKIAENSINKHGGFYIARYEAAKSSEDNLVSKAGETPLTNVNYEEADKIAAAVAVDMPKECITSLPYGAMWDSILDFMVGYGNISTEVVISDSDSYGNYSNNEITVAKDRMNSSAYTSVTTSKMLKTGYSYVTKINNIYDMAGNAAEWTKQTYNQTRRVIRGGSYLEESTVQPISFRDGTKKTSYKSKDLGFRVALYIK